jgi:hypothetical protein
MKEWFKYYGLKFSLTAPPPSGLTVFICICICFLGCEKQYPWKLQSDNTQTLVVDGILTNEPKAQCIKLSSVNPGMNLPYTPLSGATINVSDSTHVYQFNESSQEPGSYYSLPFQAVVGKTYTLTINYQSITYTANAASGPVTAFDQINLIKDKELYRYNHVKYGDPAMIEVYLDWSSDPAYCETYGHCQAQETFYVLNNVDVNNIFGPAMDTIYFPVGTKIIRKKYSLSEEHQAFIRTLLIETEWRGGIFDVQQGNVLSNISNGARGFFGACMVISDTTVVK